jgi:hypothetical protein
LRGGNAGIRRQEAVRWWNPATRHGFRGNPTARCRCIVGGSSHRSSEIPAIPVLYIERRELSCRAFEVCEDCHERPAVSDVGSPSWNSRKASPRLAYGPAYEREEPTSMLEVEESSAASNGVPRSTRKGATKWRRYQTADVCTSTSRFQCISTSRRNVIWSDL